MAWIKVARLEDLPPGAFLKVMAGETELALFNVQGNVCCIEDFCTHDGGTLVEGDFDGRVVTCPRHGAQFDVCSGEALCLPAVMAVPTHRTRIVDGEIEVEVGPEMTDAPPLA